MISRLTKRLLKPVNSSIKRTYIVPTAKYGHLADEPGLVAKRLINCIGERLREFDPHRWEGVPITFKTNFSDEAGHIDIATSIQIHDAVEREFLIDVNDRHILIASIEQAYFVVMEAHDAH